jgi:hypothetical protein
MTSIELTDAQRQALQRDQGEPVDLVDPATQQRYVLLAREQYERMRSLLEKGATLQRTAVASGVHPGILRSQQAFRRDLPGLLKDKRNRGKWVCYHTEERIGIGTYQGLIRECVRRGIEDNEYDLEVIEPHAFPPWDLQEIEAGGHEVEDVDSDHQPGTAGRPA